MPMPTSSTTPAPPPSLWHAALPPPPPPPAALPPHADVVVLGGGLSGVWLALALAEAGRPPLVLERAHLAAGASGRNGGLLLPGTSELYPALVARHGRAAARALWAWAVAGAADVVATIARYGIDCDWRGEGALHAAMGDAEALHLREAAALLGADGFPGAWLAPDDVAAWLDVPRPAAVRGALHLPDGGAFHSGRLVAGLAAAAASQGATFAQGIDVRGIDRHHDGRPVVVHTDRGPTTAEVVIVATNAWLPELLPHLGAAVVPVRGQVLSLSPLPSRAIRGGWSLNDGYEYLQQLSNGRLVFGGMRWAAPDREVGAPHIVPTVNDAIHAGLDRWLAEHFPSLAAAATVEHRWAGPMCWTADRLPLVGAVRGQVGHRRNRAVGAGRDDDVAADRAVDPSSQRLWVAGAYSGHGVPVAPAAARLIAAGLTGGEAGGDPEAGGVAAKVDPNRALERPEGARAP